MTRRTNRILTATLACFCLTLGLAQAADAAAPTLGDLLGKMPSENPQISAEVSAQILEMGADTVVELCGKLVATGAGDDTKERFALHGVAVHAARPGAESERKLFSDALIRALDMPLHAEVKAFLMSQIQLAGKNEAIEPLAAYLMDETLCEPATQALLAIGKPGVGAALRAALPAVDGARRVTIIRALGAHQSKEGTKELLVHAQSPEKAIRWAALYALAQSGSYSAEEPLTKLAMLTSDYERTEANTLLSLYARRLNELGRKDRAARISRALIKTRVAPNEENVVCSALSILAQAEGKRALPDMAKAFDSDCIKIRAAILRLTLDMPGKTVTNKWIDMAKSDSLSSVARAEIVEMLGRRGDVEATPALVAALADDEKAVRLAAIDASARLDAVRALPALLVALKTEDADEIKAAQAVIGRMSDEKALPAVAAALPEVSTPARAALLDVLAAREATIAAATLLAHATDDDRAVRVAALKALRFNAAPADLLALIEALAGASNASEEAAARRTVGDVAEQIDNVDERAAPFLAALEKAEGTKRIAIVRILPRVASAKTLAAARTAAAADDAELKDAGVRALAEWPEQGAAADLLAVAQKSENVTHQVLALRGYTRLASDANLAPGKKLSMLDNAMKAAKRADEKKLVLEALGDVRSAGALAQVAPFLDDDALRVLAVQTIVKIACPQNKNDKGLVDAPVAAVLEKAKAACKDPKLLESIEAHLKTIPKEPAPAPTADADADALEVGFTRLFNGKDLTGWVGNTKGYVAEDGKIVVHPELGGGNLYTDMEYADFHLKFEFKLTPGANNGLGIRAPLTGDAAYAGMELQILDNTAAQYAKLQPYQYHGSVYGVIAADYGDIPATEGGYLKPVGEWNQQEVIARGSHITVILNDKPIVDGDILEAAPAGSENRKRHPGLDRKKGHIGFLGHGSPLEFRNLRIKDLGGATNEPPDGFTALFNGKDLSGWKGLLSGPNDNPIKRAQLSPENLEKAQAEADELMRAHWSVVGEDLLFDGKGHSLATARDYEDFEMVVDWKIEKDGDSGLYLRGTPQVQIWDTARVNSGAQVGSGGLYNNKTNPSKPLVCADNPVGTWNTFRIKMIGERVTVHLNGQLVVDDTIQENYWDRAQPIFPSGQIELQCHGNPVWFKNIFLREIPRK